MAMTQFTGMEYLQMDVAANFGYSKKTWSERLDWFKTNESQLESLIKQAKEPAMYYAAVKAMRKAQMGETVNYPVSLDGTSSGLQILACLTGDRKAALLCNVLNNNNLRMDAYKEIYERMLKALGTKAVLKADDVKQAVMTSLYGSQAVPREVFGDGSNQLAQFYKTMEAEAPMAWELNTAFLSMWDPNKDVNAWVLPDNFHAVIKVMGKTSEVVEFLGKTYSIDRMVQMPQKEGRSLGANVTHSVDGMIVREMTRRCDFDPIRVDAVRQALKGQMSDFGKTTKDDEAMVALLWQHYQDSGFLSARILDHLGIDNMHHVDSAVIEELLNSLPAKPFKILTIHDCFRCLPNYANDMRFQYAHQLAMIAKSNLLSFIISQIMGRYIPVNKGDLNMWKEIYDSEYAIC